MKISEDRRRVEYRNYQEYLDHQATRRNVLSEDNPAIFDPEDHPWIVKDLELFYRFIRSDWLVLDAGCRSGWSCLRMQHDGYPNVIGIDVQYDNIVFGRAWGAPVELADVHDLPFADDTFDAIFNRSALEHFFDPDKVLAECYRVLKQDGVLFLVAPVDEGITEFEFAHAHAFSTDQLLEMVARFQRLYLKDNGREVVYVGKKAEKAKRGLGQLVQGLWYLLRGK